MPTVGAVFELSTLNATTGFKINGAAADDNAGTSVSAAGDVNGDGIDDLIVGANRAGRNDAGAAYVVYGIQKQGTAGNDMLTGSARGNTIAGFKGNDTISGGGGDDNLRGDAGDDRLNGGDGSDKLIGGAGRDVLNGGAGRDKLYGGAGVDVFVFDMSLTAANRDQIGDFNVKDDTIQLDHAIFTMIAAGTLDAGALATNTSGNAADASDRIIYETDTGKLFYDLDGTGSAAKVEFALIGKNLALTHADFFILA